jgi:hypothetical protein
MLAVALSAVALIVSFTALGVALNKKGTGSSTATRLTGAATQAPAPVSTTSDSGENQAPATDSSTDSGPDPTDTGEVNPQTTYTKAYDAVKQRVPKGISIDVDTPRVNPASGGDIYYGSGGDLSKSLGGEDAAVVQTAGASPQDCADAIQNAPLTGYVTAAEGVTLCVQTDAGEASSEGVTQKMARMTVKSIDKFGVMTIELTAWNVPT